MPSECNTVPDTRGARPLDVSALLDDPRMGRAAGDARIEETHISWVLLAGEHAYKIRKPVALPFLDFTSLEARRRDCERELELNRRWAPGLYLDVIPVIGTRAGPRLTGDGPVIDYAVRMRRFPDDARLDRVAERGDLEPALVDALADVVAHMHEQAPPAAPGSDHGSVRAIAQQVQGNLDAIDAFDGVSDTAALEKVRAASVAALARLAPVFAQRRAQGRVRECHGDLHLQNLALVDGQVTPFDGVEFDPALRFVDVASDLAFLLMDLHGRGMAAAAHHVLDRYLQHTGDYDALRVLRHYLCYRAMVRAKVTAIRASQVAGDARARHAAAVNRLLGLAARLAADTTPAALIITRGLSGSGKSWLTGRLAVHLPGVCVRSDVERRRLYPDADSALRYGAAATDATYERLLALARTALEAGYTPLVDATFLDAGWRERFRDLAACHAVPFRLLDLVAPRSMLESRVRRRAERGGDASEADLSVLARQCDRLQPLGAGESADALTLDTTAGLDLARVSGWITDGHPGAPG